jgi:hypothetical protein
MTVAAREGGDALWAVAAACFADAEGNATELWRPFLLANGLRGPRTPFGRDDHLSILREASAGAAV